MKQGIFDNIVADTKAHDNDLNVDPDDVRVEPIEPVICELCNERPVTHEMRIDLRVLGMDTVLMQGCEPCITASAETLRSALPGGGLL